MEINPRNIYQRVFACVVLLIAFASSASIVGRLSAAMTQSEAAWYSERIQLARLKQYLFDNNISSKLAIRVYRSAKLSLNQNRKQTPDSEIKTLSMITIPLKLELHCELKMPVLRKHDFFRRCGEGNRAMMGHVCENALTRSLLSRGDVLFNVAEAARNPAMYFLIDGIMVYQHFIRGRVPVECPSWACEAAVWVSWTHCGSLAAQTSCSVLRLSTRCFQDIAMKFPVELHSIRAYAKLFVAYLNASRKEELTDLQSNMLVKSAVMEAFHNHPQEQEREQLGSARMSRLTLTRLSASWPIFAFAVRAPHRAKEIDAAASDTDHSAEKKRAAAASRQSWMCWPRLFRPAQFDQECVCFRWAKSR